MAIATTEYPDEVVLSDGRKMMLVGWSKPEQLVETPNGPAHVMWQRTWLHRQPVYAFCEED